MRRARAVAQLLRRPPGTSAPSDPAAAVRHLLAVQAQDLRSARLALRARGAAHTAAEVDAALAAGHARRDLAAARHPPPRPSRRRRLAARADRAGPARRQPPAPRTGGARRAHHGPRRRGRRRRAGRGGSARAPRARRAPAPRGRPGRGSGRAARPAPRGPARARRPRARHGGRPRVRARGRLARRPLGAAHGRRPSGARRRPAPTRSRSPVPSAKRRWPSSRVATCAATPPPGPRTSPPGRVCRWGTRAPVWSGPRRTRGRRRRDSGAIRRRSRGPGACRRGCSAPSTPGCSAGATARTRSRPRTRAGCTRAVASCARWPPTTARVVGTWTARRRGGAAG